MNILFKSLFIIWTRKYFSMTKYILFSPYSLFSYHILQRSLRDDLLNISTREERLVSHSAKITPWRSIRYFNKTIKTLNHCTNILWKSTKKYYYLLIKVNILKQVISPKKLCYRPVLSCFSEFLKYYEILLCPRFLVTKFIQKLKKFGIWNLLIFLEHKVKYFVSPLIVLFNSLEQFYCINWQWCNKIFSRPIQSSHVTSSSFAMLCPMCIIL